MYTENLVIGVESMAWILMNCCIQILLNVYVLLAVIGSWIFMIALDDVLQDVDLLLGLDFNITICVVVNSNFALIRYECGSAEKQSD